MSQSTDASKTNERTAHPPGKTLRCLVIQLSPLGDSLQSLLALRAAQQLYQNLEVHFIAQDSFAQVAKQTPWVKDVFNFPAASLAIGASANKADLGPSIKEVAKWLSPVIENPWDMVINWSFTEASSYLTSLIPARVKLGYSRRVDTSFVAVDGWSQYIQGVVHESTPQNIHLTDILTTQLLTALQIHVGDPGPSGEEAVTSKSFFTSSHPRSDIARRIGLSGRIIGIQLGASNEREDWGAPNWAKLAALALSTAQDQGSDLKIVLLGSSKDLRASQEFLTQLSMHIKQAQVICLVGETEFEDWAYAISRCSWLFSSESPAIALCGVLATPVITVTNNTKLKMQSAPYGNGSYLLTPLTEGQTVPPEALHAVWSFAQAQWNQAPNLSVHLDSLLKHSPELIGQGLLFRAYRSAIRPSQNGGGVAYEQLVPGDKRKPEYSGLGLMTFEEWMAQVVGHIARAWYCGWVPSIGLELKRGLIGPALIQNIRALEEASNVLAKIYSQSMQTAEQMQKLAGNLKSEKLMSLGDKESFKELGLTLVELTALGEKLASNHPGLKVFLTLEKVFMHNLKGQSLLELGKETYAAHQRIHEGVQILRQWITHTLELTKPVSIKKTRLLEMEHQL